MAEGKLSILRDRDVGRVVHGDSRHILQEWRELFSVDYLSEKLSILP